MKLANRWIPAGSLVLSLMLPGLAAAQGKPLEIRADFVTLETSDGDTDIALEFPGSLAMAFYFSRQFALEPAVLINNINADDASATLFGFGLSAPFYFKADEGKSGLFVSPGIFFSKATGDFETDAMFDYGVDVGFKMPVKERISTRLAVTFRDGDSSDKAVVGASFGIGFFWR